MHRRQPTSFFVLLATLLLAVSGCQQSAADIERHFQEQLISAKPGAVIELPEGKFHFTRTLSLTVDKVTLRGKGMDKTVLNFAGQKEGAQGILVKANDFTIEDIDIEDPAGDASPFRAAPTLSFAASAPSGPRPQSFQRPLRRHYPVDCKNLLVEDSTPRRG
jgi:hypothetical protein